MGSDVKYTTNHDVIRRWVEARGGWPAKFRRIYFSRYVTRGVLPRVRWEEFFQTFEEQRLAFLYQEHTATGRLSHFFRIVSRRPDDVGECSPPLESSIPQTAAIPAIVDGGLPHGIDGEPQNAAGL
jgi:hypothetical protein